MIDHYTGKDDDRVKCLVPVQFGREDEHGNITCGRWMIVPEPPINGFRKWYCIYHKVYQYEAHAIDITEQKLISNLRPCTRVEVRRIK